ncbi:MAG: hypothetical protein JWL75_561 [Parcubacteria group bacterium]|nr:hypothetical protein [Parcubacteria group bacterium]
MQIDIKSAVKEVEHLLEAWLPLRLQYDKVLGASIAIIYKGEILYKKGFGYADLEKKIETDENTLYRVGSVSKIFTSAAIFQLAEQKEITITDPVSKYLPWFKGENEKGKLEDITIEELLSHMSGIWGNGNTPHWFTGEFPTTLEPLPSEALVFEPSSEFKYSNYGFAVLGELIATVTGLPYEKYVQTNILHKLGMASTFTDYKDDIAGIANGLGREIPGQEREKYGHYATNAYAPATGFISNVVDLAKYIATFPVSASEEILKNESKQKMIEEPDTYSRGTDKYCLGIEKYEIDGKKIYGHGGGFKGFVSQVSIDADNELGVVVLTNSSKAPVWTYTQSIFQAIYGIAENSSDYLSENKIDTKRYEGIYRNSGEDNVVVRIKDVLISFGINTSSPLFGNNKTILHPISEDVFLLEGGGGFGAKGETVTFSDMKDGLSQRATFAGTPMIRVNQ